MSSEKWLLRLAAALEDRVRDEEFDSSTWTQHFGCPRSAIGWSPVWFVSEGFDIVSLDGIEWTPVYETDDRTYVGWQAVAAFFGITEDAALKLFDESEPTRLALPGGRSRQECVDRIRAFVKDAFRQVPRPWDGCSSAFSQ